MKVKDILIYQMNSKTKRKYRKIFIFVGNGKITTFGQKLKTKDIEILNLKLKESMFVDIIEKIINKDAVLKMCKFIIDIKNKKISVLLDYIKDGQIDTITKELQYLYKMYEFIIYIIFVAIIVVTLKVLTNK